MFAPNIPLQNISGHLRTSLQRQRRYDVLFQSDPSFFLQDNGPRDVASCVVTLLSNFGWCVFAWQVQRRGEREGLGTAQSSGNPFAVGSDGRISKWEQMRRRFAESQASGSGFASSGPRRDSVRWLAGKAEGGSG